MPSLSAFSQDQADLVSGCHSCPLARHLGADRFACADRVCATNGRHEATQQCHEAIVESPHKYFQPLPLSDLQGISPESVCDYIGLAVNLLDPDEDQTPAGNNFIEIHFNGYKVGMINKTGEWYSCDRIIGTSFTDAHYLALHLIHPDFLYQIPEEIIANRIDLEYM